MIKRVTIKDVAMRANVSPATVSNVMLGRKAATLEVADRVRAAAEALGYVADRSASQLRSGKTRIVTVLVPNLTDPFFAGMIAALERCAQGDDFDIIVASSNADEETERKRLSALLSWRPSGVVVVPHRDDFPSRTMIDDLEIPYVVLDRAATTLNVDAVVTDNRAATSDAAAHLLDQGHRDILVVTSTFRLENIRERYAGVVDQFALRGMAAPPSLEVGLTFELVAERMANWLAANARPTAFMTVTNFVTMGVLSHLTQIGVGVPRDVSLVGFDDYPWMRAASPALTTLRQDIAALANQTWATLQQRMGAQAAPSLRSVIPCELIIRDSVRPVGPPVPAFPAPPRRRPKRMIMGVPSP